MSNADLIMAARSRADATQSLDRHHEHSAKMFRDLANALEACENRIADLTDQLAHCQTSRQKTREEVLRALDKRLAGKDQGK